MNGTTARWIGAALFSLLAAACTESGTTDLAGAAEDLWGNRIDLGAYRKGVTLIEPVSPSNCGYCLVDGEFARANYHERVRRLGGTSFYQMLFNPQIDIETWRKHFRDETTPVLTAPLDLHRWHRDGFPYLIAFRDGEPVYSGGLHPYEETYRRVAALLWPEADEPLVPTSPMHMATRFVFENEGGLGVYVTPDGDEAGLAAMRERTASWEGEPLLFRLEKELTAADREKNLYFRGEGAAFRFDGIAGGDGPVTIGDGEIRVGPFRFSVGEVGVRCAFPNPRAPERYVVLELIGPGGALPGRCNDLDFAVCGPRATSGEAPLLLEGKFARDGTRWSYADSLVRKGPSVDRFCAGGLCAAPAAGGAPAGEVRTEASPVVRAPGDGMSWIAGGSGARFPSLAARPGGGFDVTWEEGGNILLASVHGDGRHESAVVEGDRSDSFHPVLVRDGDALWVFYLNDRDGFYRVYGRRVDSRGPGPAILVSERGPWDAVTPAAASDGRGTVAVMWSEWRANFRRLKYRSLGRGVLGPVREGAVVPSDIDYVNAWCPSVAYDRDGALWGAWNQHYPAILGVGGGDPAGAVASVTAPGATIHDAECGGYPCAVTGGDGERWVVWESFAWDALSGRPQRILASRYSRDAGAWTVPEAVTGGDEPALRQTPRGATDRSGALCVVWSERKEGDEGWSVYGARRDDRGWSAPERLSAEGENARAPALVRGEEGMYAAWHAGRGDSMTIRVVRAFENGPTPS